MGTNFYLRSAVCDHCKRHGEELHIGKSSAGWNFGLRIYPELDHDKQAAFNIVRIVELDDWKELFVRHAIFDEYGDRIAPEVLLSNIAERSHPNGLLSRLTAGREHMGPYGGHPPHELIAGKGTYDLCNYEFS